MYTGEKKRIKMKYFVLIGLVTKVYLALRGICMWSMVSARTRISSKLHRKYWLLSMVQMDMNIWIRLEREWCGSWYEKSSIWSAVGWRPAFVVDSIGILRILERVSRSCLWNVVTYPSWYWVLNLHRKISINRRS